MAEAGADQHQRHASEQQEQAHRGQRASAAHRRPSRNQHDAGRACNQEGLEQKLPLGDAHVELELEG